ncbi:gluconolaconase [Sphingomonas piscis]|uniref:Gluconolaconase n=1 Tax=Sphingomonas piscis TaxID=2714943 RepID=A0A6G7YQP7_9SPHN|nr:glycosyl hydrolase family 28-related protein [Sphingomonas piscis]QIK79059.1 gluconolaconase [Sphingomonas piscis]
MRTTWVIAALAASALSSAALASPSVMTTLPDDPRAVVVKAVGDGRADDTAAIQQAIDKAASTGAGGIVFLPQGRYRITRTLFIWPAVRLFGVGATRPVIELGDRTPGFQRGISNMIVFTGTSKVNALGNEGPRIAFPVPGSVPFNPRIGDANSGTFYSALSNVDFKIGSGNPAATAVRFHTAQHSFVSNADFDLGSGLAGLYQVANVAENLHFRGGRYGILAEKTSPAWGFALVDSTFDGQRDAAIREHEAGLTMLNVSFRNTPVGVEIDKGNGDWLFGKGLRFDNVRRAGVVISNEKSATTQVGFEDVTATNTPVFARMRDSGKEVRGQGRAYNVASFTHGLTLPGMGAMGTFKTDMKAAPIASAPAASTPVLRSLPPVGEWVNVRTLGAKGDNATDDTAAIQRAIDTNKTVYFPAGFYLVTDTLRLRPDSVLVGLHPGLTQIVIPDKTPAFQGVGAPKALVQTAEGGEAVVVGLGLHTGGINPRAVGLLWTAGANSMASDIKFQGGHGTDLFDGKRVTPINDNGTGDPDPAKGWDRQYSSLWVTKNGGGTFFNIWSPSTYAHPGLYVSDTTTPGKIIQASVEHHVRTEFAFNRVANWELYAPQTEEEAGEGLYTVGLEIRDSRDMLVANYHGYRVTRTREPAPAAVTLYNSRNIRFRNMAVNGESGLPPCDDEGCFTYLRLTKYPFDNAIRDVAKGIDVRERQFAVLDVTGQASKPAVSTFGGAQVEKLASDFHSIGGGAVGADGTLYFTDRKRQRIYGWSDSKKLEIVRDQPLDPVNLAVDASGNIMVLSAAERGGPVYSFMPGSPDDQINVIKPAPVAGTAGAAVAIPANWWANSEFRDRLNPRTYQFETMAEIFAKEAGAGRPKQYVSPDGSLAIPAWRVVQQGPDDFRAMRFSHGLDTYGFVTAKVGERVLVANSSENKTYSALVGKGGSLTDLRVVADRGGESVAKGPDGRIYVANGQIFVYSPDGAELGRIDVPERPLQLIFGGADRRSLFVLTHRSLYRVRFP